MSEPFASTGELTEKRFSFTEVGPRVYVFATQGDPNPGVIIGDDCAAIADAQPAPKLAEKVIAGDWPRTLDTVAAIRPDAIAAGRGDALVDASETREFPHSFATPKEPAGQTPRPDLVNALSGRR